MSSPGTPAKPGASVPTANPPTYSDAPISTINLDALTASRFIMQKERALPYRDSEGRVNVHLVEASLAEAVRRGAEEAVTRLEAWLRHARRALEPLKVTPATGSRVAHRRTRGDESENEEMPPTDHGTPRAKRQCLAASPMGTPARPVRTPALRADLSSPPALQRRSSPPPSRRSSAAPLSPLLSYTRSMLNADSERSGSDSDIYEVERIIREGEGNRFLIRWAGYDAGHDTWEPEANIAAGLVATFRQEQAEAATYQGHDYVRADSQRRLWCRKCGTHLHPDNFSQQMRSTTEAKRTCLRHRGEMHTSTPPRSTATVSLSEEQLARCRQFGLSSW